MTVNNYFFNSVDHLLLTDLELSDWRCLFAKHKRMLVRWNFLTCHLFYNCTFFSKKRHWLERMVDISADYTFCISAKSHRGTGDCFVVALLCL